MTKTEELAISQSEETLGKLLHHSRMGPKQVRLHARKWRAKMCWTLKICYLQALRRHGRPVLVTQPWPKVEEVRQI